MTAWQKSRMLFIVLFTSLPGYCLAGLDNGTQEHEISLNYLDKGTLKGHIRVQCSEQNDVCESLLEFEQGGDTPPALAEMQFQGHFQRDLNDFSELGSITVLKDSRETKIPLGIDYDELSLGDKNNPTTRAVIAHLHPSLIHHAKKELDNITEAADYLTGTTRNSQTLHLFKPEPHKLSLKDSEKLANSIHGDFIVLDIGESYSMVLIFNQDNVPELIYVLDRWKLYRDPIFKTIIGYGDLVGLVLHGMDFVKHGGSLLGITSHDDHHSHFAFLKNLANSVGIGPTVYNILSSLISSGFHIAEIIDHAHGVCEFISGGQKHYHDHDHGKWEKLFGTMHLAHTAVEMIAEPSLAHGIQTVLTFASFGYHHVPHQYYEYPMSDVLRPVMHSRGQSTPDAEIPD
ncbi:hypothetical protein [Endozoicomonas sp. ONNA2]|uniref:hypothetical protein n=1 Tax=Endozoicomonas sp. ONNA2 TaxID=2828741 RepID=UPI0021494A2C|nr:hypothetical protein [Endozoicomonas sp. ONNA2]